MRLIDRQQILLLEEALGVPILMTRQDAATFAGVSLTTINAWIRDGSIRVADRFAVRQVIGPSVQAYLAARQQPTAPTIPEPIRWRFTA